MMKSSSSPRERLLAFLDRPGYEPATKSDLARALEVPPKERQAFRALLRELEEAGDIRQIRKGRYIARTGRAGELNGEIRFHPKGHAFVYVEGERETLGFDRVFIHPKNTATALNGDRVALLLQKPPVPEWTRNIRNDAARRHVEALQDERDLEGVVVKVLERRNAFVVGTFRREGKFAFVQLDEAFLPPTIELDRRHPLPDPEPADGYKVVARVTEWTSRTSPPRGQVTEVLGPAGEPGIDILSIIHKHRLPLEFPPEVLAEARAVADSVTADDLAMGAREDWRDRPIMTIDPVDARDFDDAILVTPLENGDWELAVHIADVSHYVKPGSALDREAEKRGNSVYLVDRVIPMLPPNLSNGICSLRPDEDRLTRAAIMRFDASGHLKKVRFVPAVIRSQKRLTYEEAYARMKLGPAAAAEDPVAERLQTAWKLASVLRARRFEQGGLDLDFPEIKVLLDAKGAPRDLVRIEYDESHQMIEEFMLAANEAVAKATKDALKPSIYRVHEDPDEDRLDQFRDLILSHGIQVGDLTNRAEVQRLLRSVRGLAEEHAIKIGLLKSLKRATYDAEPIGHYGLAKVNYTHFTSPIRRYSDLIVHRVLNSLTGHSKDPVPGQKRLVEIAEHLSTTERAAADAETESQKLKQLEYFDRLVRESPDDPPVYRAAIVEVRRMGLFVELSDYFIRGLVRVEDFPRRADGYFFDPQRLRYASRNPPTTFQTGGEVAVTVSRVDLVQKLIDFRIVEADGRKPGAAGRKPPKPERRRKEANPAPKGQAPKGKAKRSRRAKR